MDAEDNKPTNPKVEKINKTLMRLEKPIFELQKKEESETEYVLRKIMVRKPEKPKIELIGRSPLLSQLEAVIPIFKKANEQLKMRDIAQSQKIDAKLQLVDESESSSDSQQRQEVDEKVRNESEMVDEGQQQNNNEEIELNFMRYPYPQQQLQPMEQKEIPIDGSSQQKGQQKKNLIQQL